MKNINIVKIDGVYMLNSWDTQYPLTIENTQHLLLTLLEQTLHDPDLKEVYEQFTSDQNLS